MPDMTIPGGALISIGVLFLAVQSFRTGEWRTAVVAGAIGTLLNYSFFFRRLLIQDRLHKRIRELTAARDEIKKQRS